MPTRHRSVVVRCPDCGEQRVPLDSVTLRRCVDDDAWSYRARCPECRFLLADVTSERAALSAVASGADLEEWHVPLELDEHPSGPEFTLGDVLALRLALIEDDWIEQLRRYDAAS